MLFYGHKYQGFLTFTTFCVVLGTLSACSVVGPRSISMGRADYNEAINRTEDEQMLLSIVNPTSCLFIVSGGKLGNFQTVIHVISIGYISG